MSLVMRFRSKYKARARAACREERKARFTVRKAAHLCYWLFPLIKPFKDKIMSPSFSAQS